MLLRAAGSSRAPLTLPRDSRSTKIFRLAGQNDPTMASLAVGITNFGASVVALYIVNSYGRRPLMFIGSVGQLIGLVRRAAASAPRCAHCVAAHDSRCAATFSLHSTNDSHAPGATLIRHGLHLPSPQAMGAAAILQTGSGSVSETAGWVLVAGLLFFVVNFAYSSGPLTWVVISEVFPMRARGKGAGVATAFNWLANYIVRRSPRCRRCSCCAVTSACLRLTCGEQACGRVRVH